MSQRGTRLLVIALVLVVGIALRDSAPDPSPLPRVPNPGTGLQCFRAGGDHGYCECLDRLEAARAVTGRGSGLPPLDHPTIRYAMRHPQQYPIINSDTLRCITPPASDTPGVFA